MAFQLKNPLHYPLAMLAGGIVLVLGVRLVRLPSAIALPAAIAVAIGTAAIRPEQASPTSQSSNKSPDLSAELDQLYSKALDLTAQAELLREEASDRLRDAEQVELLGAVQYACDRTQELPDKLQGFMDRMGDGKALLSAAELTQQIADATAKRDSSSGPVQAQWQTLVDSLQRNLSLAQEGENASQAQIANLSTLLSNAAGTLQQLQNKLRTADLSNTHETSELRALSDEFRNFQENVDLLAT
jgi:hypothetical protein